MTHQQYCRLMGFWICLFGLAALLLTLQGAGADHRFPFVVGGIRFNNADEFKQYCADVKVRLFERMRSLGIEPGSNRFGVGEEVDLSRVKWNGRQLVCYAFCIEQLDVESQRQKTAEELIRYLTMEYRPRFGQAMEQIIAGNEVPTWVYLAIAEGTQAQPAPSVAAPAAPPPAAAAPAEVTVVRPQPVAVSDSNGTNGDSASLGGGSGSSVSLRMEDPPPLPEPPPESGLPAAAPAADLETSPQVAAPPPDAAKPLPKWKPKAEKKAVKQPIPAAADIADGGAAYPEESPSPQPSASPTEDALSVAEPTPEAFSSPREKHRAPKKPAQVEEPPPDIPAAVQNPQERNRNLVDSEASAWLGGMVLFLVIGVVSLVFYVRKLVSKSPGFEPRRR